MSLVARGRCFRPVFTGFVLGPCEMGPARFAGRLQRLRGSLLFALRFARRALLGSDVRTVSAAPAAATPPPASPTGPI